MINFPRCLPNPPPRWVYTGGFTGGFILAHYGFPIYILLINTVMVLFVKFKMGKRLALSF